jgi:hypothetical protein
MSTVRGTSQRGFISNHQVSSPRAVRRKRFARLRRGLSRQIVWRAISSLKPFPKNPRRHPEAQIAALMKSISRVWTNPILIDESGTILAGHLRLEVGKRLGMAEVPTIMIAGLSESEKCLWFSSRRARWEATASTQAAYQQIGQSLPTDLRASVI